MTHKDIIKLNLGCGPNGIKGWINYDWGILPVLSKIPYIRRFLIKLKVLSKSYDAVWPDIELVDIRRKLPLENESVNYIYCSHVLEHFEKYEALNILKECRRVLKEGGVIRVVLPDLREMIRKYKDAEEFNREFFGYEKDEKSIFNLFIRGHQWMYDESSFLRVFEEVFGNVKKCSFRKGVVPDLEKLDLEIHNDHSFYTEARK